VSAVVGSNREESEWVKEAGELLGKKALKARIAGNWCCVLTDRNTLAAKNV
jgi:hypothetical protein